MGERAGTIGEPTEELTDPAQKRARRKAGTKEAGESQKLWIRDRERMHFDRSSQKG